VKFEPNSNIFKSKPNHCEQLDETVTELTYVENPDNAPEINMLCKWISTSYLPIFEKVLLIIMLRNATRISVITEPDKNLMIDNNMLFAYEKKQKLWRTVKTYETKHLVHNPNFFQILQSWSRSRNYYYRVMNLIVPPVPSRRTKNNPVCHAARNLQGHMTFLKYQNIQDVKNELNLSSTSAAWHYV